MDILFALAQIKIEPAQPKTNYEKMLGALKEAKQKGADVIIYPEMSIPGYFIGDIFGYEYFLRECEEYGQKFIEQTDGICAVFGNIAIDWQKKNHDGSVRKYNACFIAQDKFLVKNSLPYPFYIKSAMPNYRQFEDSRHFYSNTSLALELGKPVKDLIEPFTANIKGCDISLGCLICEDGWTDLYPVKPPDILADKNPDVIVNISSSPFAAGKNALRRSIFSGIAQSCQKPLIYVNHTGMQNNGKNIYTFDGASCVFDKQGHISTVCNGFAEELGLAVFSTDKADFHRKPSCPNAISETQTLCTALIHSCREFLKTCGITKMTIGLSGGIDSALSAALLAHVLGANNILLINMPSRYNSNTTKDLAAKLAANLGTHYAVLTIEESLKLTVGQIESISIGNDKLQLSSFMKENIQARDRSARILAAAASAFGGAFTCNANKSELTAGYGTFYGDLAGAFAPLGDLWKHQVYELAGFFNTHIFKKEVIPKDIFTIMPSAELSPEQTVGNGGDPLHYPYHDYLFKAFVEENISIVEIASFYMQNILEEKIGCEKALVSKLFKTPADFFHDLEKWWQLLHGLSVAKRVQSPPIITLSKHSFGSERREAQVKLILPDEYKNIKKTILKGTDN